MYVPSRAIRLAALCLVGLSGSATYANVMAYDVLLDNGGAHYVCGDSGTFQLPMFDDAGGNRRLCWMALAVTATAVNGSLVFDNETPGLSGPVTLGLGVRVNVFTQTVLTPIGVSAAPQVTLAAAVAEDDPAESGPGTYQGDYYLNADFRGPDSAAVFLAQAADQQAVTLDVLDCNLSEFIGSGFVTLRFDSAILEAVEQAFPAFQQLLDAPQFDLHVQIIYGTEVGVPEPTSISLLAAVGLWVLCRNRRTLQWPPVGTSQGARLPGGAR